MSITSLCQASETVTSVLARTNPKEAPEKIVKQLYGHHQPDTSHNHRGQTQEKDAAAMEQLALECGKWGNTKPSSLFLRMYGDALLPLASDPLAGMCSPPYLGTTGVCPLTVISTVHDISRHMSNCIVRAQHEVILATNFWQASDCASFITNAFKELSRRREGKSKVVVKLEYDRGNVKQIMKNHQVVTEKEWLDKAVQLPHLHEIPNIDLQVVNYHKPMLGTFHCKYMVVDKKIAILQSNNLQETDNVEMMCQYEGGIVESMYDMALISWNNAMDPPLPLLGLPSPDAVGIYPSFQDPTHASIFKSSPESQEQSSSTGNGTTATPPQLLNGSLLDTYFGNNVEQPAPNANPTYAHFASGALAQSAYQSKDQLPEHTAKDPHYDPNIAAEIRRMQATVSPRSGETRRQAVTRLLNTTKQPDTTGDGPEFDLADEMTPFIPIPSHDPVPMAMVNRKPFGTPNNSDVFVPQNQAFLSGFRNATKNVFIQTPTLNAVPLLPEIVKACKRGIDVYCFVTIGYNDAGELLPGQGGTNEMTSHKLHTELNAAATGTDESHNPANKLHIFWYTAKDQSKPINAKYKKRDSHIKLMIVDEHVAIQGNGNQDAQSWFHSQEINVMLDSELICRTWIEALRRNQNTGIFGRVSSKDGIWRDAEGKEVEGSMGANAGGKFSWAKGVVGAVQRVRGAGGF